MSKTEEAVTALSELGLTEYEARCFVALTKITTGTAKEISQVSDVPRSRVYDTIERLDRKGLVDVQQSDPREYRATEIETACRRIREDYDSRINAAENALEQIEQPDATEDAGVWSISETDHVTDRIVTFLSNAEEAIHHVVATDDVIDDAILEELRTATDRGVEVVLEVPTEDDRAAFEEAVPAATVVVAPDLETTNPVYSEWPAQLLLVDHESVVAAALKEGGLPDVVQETAIWTYGHDHGVAVWIRELLDDRRAFRDRED
ncbi:TrmB family transcriptional regulator [Natronococcus sp. JC468]|uniref:TrmB family transcriptional regulator n=1 Tax=Natronococcus sp. JC468 TaxID=1961921 RepID=UPI001438C739|nr:helix-turn-helix domain-containing protein [Natronococcus sp. JC468]NKE34612.1 TrmB family transcriptional regulator [Natronococcus sp. JC468]